MFGRRLPLPSLSLALQGGGAHGAFTWGVLDALLASGLYRFDGLSGTSAGAMNAVAVAHGLACGGPDAARATLETFWLRVGASLPPEMLQPMMPGDDLSIPPGLQMALQFSRWFSPYQLNPLDYNPLRAIIDELFDFDRIRQASPVKIYIAATQANSGRLRLFDKQQLSTDALLASACLPSLQQAVSIDGEDYWDGGFAANPAVFPLIRYCRADDILLILLTPMAHGTTPRSAEDIRQRILNLGFNSAFLREMRLLALLREMAQESGPIKGKLERRLLATRFHLIEADDLLTELDAASKALAHTPFLLWLRDAGRQRAQQWLAQHGRQVGHQASVDIHHLFFE
ncbi:MULTISPECIES: patatin-like phospholipase family protein [unclassified Paludibacterium]|uniref:patatin-like phospholipase family protein n=1 Tax=unclassified Paludibacterium TaxID=2618429 RepID=UPI001C04BF70|nr:patatin-like phospholipase family protein [Paludibacterium sp. B53371]BEV73766.1 patatin-like phospholipase family protein [Paludibacterium sp. THUN1379]